MKIKIFLTNLIASTLLLSCPCTDNATARSTGETTEYGTEAYSWEDDPKFKDSIEEAKKLVLEAKASKFSDETLASMPEMTRGSAQLILEVMKAENLTVNEAVNWILEAVNNARLYLEAADADEVMNSDPEEQSDKFKGRSDLGSDDSFAGVSEDVIDNPDLKREELPSQEFEQDDDSQDDLTISNPDSRLEHFETESAPVSEQTSLMPTDTELPADSSTMDTYQKPAQTIFDLIDCPKDNPGLFPIKIKDKLDSIDSVYETEVNALDCGISEAIATEKTMGSKVVVAENIPGSSKESTYSEGIMDVISSPYDPNTFRQNIQMQVVMAIITGHDVLIVQSSGNPEIEKELYEEVVNDPLVKGKLRKVIIVR